MRQTAGRAAQLIQAGTHGRQALLAEPTLLSLLLGNLVVGGEAADGIEWTFGG